MRFTEGNPLTIIVVVGQALRDNLRTREQIETFVAQLRQGEAQFDDVREVKAEHTAWGHHWPTGFEHTFNETERRQLALLHLFQGFVNVEAFRLMGEPEADWFLPEHAGADTGAGNHTSGPGGRWACSLCWAVAITASTQQSPGSSRGFSTSASLPAPSRRSRGGSL